jgi:type I restriction enzyme M protein
MIQIDLSGRPIKLREGLIFDRATGKPVDIRKPEEKVRQRYEQILNEDYGYSYKQMDIEVFIQRGSKTKPKGEEDKADIVIYKTEDKSKRDQNRDILGIVETKRPNREDGIRQLMSYMSASSALWGVWTNEKEIEYLYKDTKTGEVKRNFVFQIPKKGETFEDIGKISKKNLLPAKNLTLIFRRILNTLYANTNISRREKLGNEMIRLLFCKIWDEMYDPHLPPKFKIGFKDDPEDVKKNIDELFKEVKKELVEDGVFDENEKILLDAKSVAYVVGELQQYSLMKTDKDVVGDAFEVFAESRFAGEKGEFFTPRPVVKTCVEIVDPQPQQKIFDPACGSGGFLIYALEHVWSVMDKNPKYRDSPELKSLKAQVAQKYFFGIDKEIDLVKIAKAYMAIVGDGRGGIVQQNSLHRPKEFEGRAKELFTDSNGKFKKFDIILTNPPFGSKIKVLKEEAGNFELGHIWKKVNGKLIQTKETRDTEPQLLFIERCLEMLKDGGTLGIVLPETIFHSPSDEYILNFIRNGNNIKCIVDLAHNTFRPYNNAKTILLVLDKGVKQQDKIVMAVAEQVGHDQIGRPIFRFDEEKQQFTDEIWDDTEIIRKELKDPFNENNRNVFVIDIKDIKNNIYVPRYYWQKKIEGLKEDAKRRNLELVQVEKLVEKGIIKVFRGHGAPPSGYKGRGEIPYVRAADIVNWEIYKNPTAMVPYEVYKAVKRNGVDLKPKDIIFVKEGSYRIGSVALVSEYDTEILLNHHSLVFRVINEDNEYGINPFYLLYLFSHELTQKQLFNKVMIDTTLPDIGDRWKELLLPVSKDKKERIKITEKIREAFEQKWKVQSLIIDLSNEYGKLTT